VRKLDFDCIAAPPPPKKKEVEDDPATDCDETVTDKDAEKFCKPAAEDAGRHFVVGVSLLAIVLSLWK